MRKRSAHIFIYITENIKESVIMKMCALTSYMPFLLIFPLSNVNLTLYYHPFAVYIRKQKMFFFVLFLVFSANIIQSDTPIHKIDNIFIWLGGYTNVKYKCVYMTTTKTETLLFLFSFLFFYLFFLLYNIHFPGVFRFR